MKNLRIITPRSCNYDLAFIHYQTEDLHASLSQAKSPSIVEVIEIRGVSLVCGGVESRSRYESANAWSAPKGVRLNQPR
ncbi:hypothetical protein OKW34_004631 [Paraburkholderia youngii]|uniref:hypothetical protein n=1 Tax=Paraburkholderia TaxID=1822464 RepID=UPI0034CD2283